MKLKNESLEAGLASQQQEKERLEEKIQNVRFRYDELVDELKGEIEKGNIEVVAKGEDLKVTVGDKILFASGRYDLQPSGKKVLAHVAKVLKKVKDQTIRVDGHTDGVKISKKMKAGYTSNWDLSAARSASVVRFLEESGISGKNLMLASFSEFHPVSENNTAQGRQKNRRVEISLIKNP
ncbi:MAG: flagellar motor protein MotB [Elusimicrobiota bacterium]